MRGRRVFPVGVPIVAVVTIISLALLWCDGSYSRAEDSVAGDWSVFLPEDGAKQLVVKNCFNCHDLSRAVKLRGDHEFWTNLIWSMVANGAEYSNEDVETMAQYLSTHLGPDQARLVVPININTAKPELLRLLSPIADRADQIVKARENGTKFETPDDLLKIDGITKEKLEKVKPFISVK